MPDKWPLANGNWSTAANWNGGTLPQPGDDVYADGKTIAIDQDVNVASIRTSQRSGGTAGGGFTSNISLTVTANIIAGTTPCLTISSPSTTIINIIGNITGGSASLAHAVTGGTITASSTWNITGNLTGGTAPANAVVIANTNITATITGTVTAGTTGSALNCGGGIITVNGNLVGGTTLFAAGAINSTSTALNCKLTINGSLSGAAIAVGGAGSYVTINSPTDIISTSLNTTNPVVFCLSSSTHGSSNVKITAPNIIGGNNASYLAPVVVDSGAALIYANCSADLTPAVQVRGKGKVVIYGNVTGSTVRAIDTFATAHGITVVGNVSGGTTGPGILNISPGPILIVGEVIGGSDTGGFGISNTLYADITVFGSTTDNTAVAINNTNTGVITIEPLTEVITMSCVELLNVTEDDVSSVQEITGPFDLQANSPEGGTYYLFRALGASVDSEKRDDFQLYKTFTGPANLPIDNTGTNRFKIQLQGTKGVADKIVTVNIQE